MINLLRPNLIVVNQRQVELIDCSLRCPRPRFAMVVIRFRDDNPSTSPNTKNHDTSPLFWKVPIVTIHRDSMRIIIEDHRKEMADERWVSYEGNMVMTMMVMMVLPTLTLLISILAMHRSASIESKWEARESITLLSATPTWPKSSEYLSGFLLFSPSLQLFQSSELTLRSLMGRKKYKKGWKLWFLSKNSKTFDVLKTDQNAKNWSIFSTLGFNFI